MAESSGTSQVTPPQLRQLESLLWIGYSSHIPAHRAACNQIRDIWPDVSFDVVARQREIASDDQVRLICDYSRAIRAEYDTTPDQALVANLAVAYEPHRYETLRMMDRVLGRSAAHRLTVSRGARDSMLVQHLSFWGRYVDSRPESLAIVFLAVPHEVFSFVLYNLARLTSIPVLVVTPEKSALLEHDRISQQRPEHRQSSINTSVFFVAESLSDIGRWQLASNLAQSGPGSEFVRPSTFFYGSSSYRTPGDKAHGAIRPRKYSARRLDPARVLHRSRSEIQRVMWQWHTTSKSRPQQSCNLLFPLAYQPEESTSPRAGEFVDQELAVDAIRTALPPTWTLRVREHPHQFQRHRPRASGYYKHFYRRSGVELVPLTESPLESLRSADAVAAVGGSLSIAAWKAAKPLLLLGHTLLKVAPGVRHVSEAEMIQPRLQELLAAPQTEFTQASRVLFDQWTVARAFSGDPGLGSTFRDHHPEITSHNLSRLLINWLKELQRQPTQRGESLRSRPR